MEKRRDSLLRKLYKQWVITMQKPVIKKEKTQKKEKNITKDGPSKVVDSLSERIQRLIALHKDVNFFLTVLLQSFEGESLKDKVVSLICGRNPLEDKEKVTMLYDSIIRNELLNVCTISTIPAGTIIHCSLLYFFLICGHQKPWNRLMQEYFHCYLHLLP